MNKVFIFLAAVLLCGSAIMFLTGGFILWPRNQTTATLCSISVSTVITGCSDIDCTNAPCGTGCTVNVPCDEAINQTGICCGDTVCCTVFGQFGSWNPMCKDEPLYAQQCMSTPQICYTKTLVYSAPGYTPATRQVECRYDQICIDEMDMLDGTTTTCYYDPDNNRLGIYASLTTTGKIFIGIIFAAASVALIGSIILGYFGFYNTPKQNCFV